MPVPANKPTDVFKYIDQSGGPDACWPWTGAYSDRDAPVWKLKGRLVNAYRVVLALVDPTFNFNDPRDVVRHKCDNKGVGERQKCCNPRHLTHGTHEQNMRDMVERERHGMNAHMLNYIRNLLAEVDIHGQPMLTHEEIAKRCGVSRSTVSMIANGDRHGRKPFTPIKVKRKQGLIGEVEPNPFYAWTRRKTKKRKVGKPSNAERKRIEKAAARVRASNTECNDTTSEERAGVEGSTKTEE